jgi:hypothetical protein
MLSVTDKSQGARGDMEDVVPFRRIARPERNYLLCLASSGVVTRFQSNHVRVTQPGRSDIRFASTFSLAGSYQRIDQPYVVFGVRGLGLAFEHALMRAVHESVRGTCDQIGSTMIEFPNHSRSYDRTRRAVRFWGHDSAIEASFFIDEDALKRIQLDAHSNESGFLNAFDSNRDLICAAAARV